jgi:tRNA G18 (ribose-2'-O)-methylase SpoU
VPSITLLSSPCPTRRSGILIAVSVMPLIEISDLDDPRLHVYRNLKKTNQTRWSPRFIAEGKKLTIQLLHSDFEVDSVLTSEKHVELLKPHLRDGVPAFVLPHQLAQLLVGQTFHAGMLGCGFRKVPPGLDDLMATGSRQLFVVCCGVENQENLGGIIRIAAGFGATAVLTGAGCSDPFCRRALRVSMGNALRVPIIEAGTDLTTMLAHLQNQHGVELVATVLDDPAERLRDFPISTDRVALLLGNEDSGLASEWLEMCDRRVTIPMHAGTDSLNVAVAAGIFLHHFAG